MRGIGDRKGLIAIVDAFLFLAIAASLCMALPALDKSEVQTFLDQSQVVRGAHEALLRGNTSGLDGGDGLEFWTYVELTLVCGDGMKMDALALKACERLLFLLPVGTWEWKLGNLLVASSGKLAGDIYCDSVPSRSGECFSLRFAPNAARS